MLVFKREISSGTVTTIELFDKKRQLERVDLRHANAHSQSKSHADRAFKGGECEDVPIEFEDRDRVLILSNHDQGNSHKNVSKAERNAGDLNSNNLFNLITTTVFIKAVTSIIQFHLVSLHYIVRLSHFTHKGQLRRQRISSPETLERGFFLNWLRKSNSNSKHLKVMADFASCTISSFKPGEKIESTFVEI